MENDSPLVPRKKAISVVAQRSGDVDFPVSPLPAAPQPYVIFVNPPPPAAPQPLPAPHPAPNPAPPAPIQHFHTTHTATTTNHFHYSRSRDRRTGQSTLGMASMALGIIACVVCWVPVLGLAAVPIGAIGATLGIVGIVISWMFGRSSIALPAGGLFVCVLAGVISIASTGTLVYWRHRVEQLIPKSLTQPAAKSPSGPAIKSPALPAIQKPVDPAILSAAQQLKIAEDACADRIKASAEYQTALQHASDAHASVAALREQSPHSAALMEASQHMIDADNALSDIVTRAQLADPTVQLARQNLAALHQSPPAH